MAVYTVEIPFKLPSLNDYIKACNTSRYKGADMKRKIEHDISWFIRGLPRFEKPVAIHFQWIEANHKRDLDNITAGGRKFILDALVKAGKLADDDSKHVTGFSDSFSYAKEAKVIVTIKEVA